jgi:uncharacterized protein YqeY
MQEQINELIKSALRAKDEIALSVYRGLKTAAMNVLVATGKTPQDSMTDEEIMDVIRKEIKKRTDAMEQYIQAGRKELADLEAKEKEILMKFIPAQLTPEEVTAKVNELLGKEIIDPKMAGKYVGLANKALRDVASGESIKKAVDNFISNLK